MPGVASLRAPLAGALALVLVGCSSAAASHATRAGSTAWTAPTCSAPTASREVAGQATDGVELWGLIDAPFPPLRAGSDVKVIVKMTGSGPLTVYADGPGGRQLQPDWGPQPHGDSSWNRPGDEWGTGFTFGEPGCWAVRVIRPSGKGSIPLTVS